MQAKRKSPNSTVHLLSPPVSNTILWGNTNATGVANWSKASETKNWTHIRSRYDGRKRNPFDEAECGHHYVRALAAWSVLTDWKPDKHE